MRCRGRLEKLGGIHGRVRIDQTGVIESVCLFTASAIINHQGVMLKSFIDVVKEVSLIFAKFNQ